MEEIKIEVTWLEENCCLQELGFINQDELKKLNYNELLDFAIKCQRKIRKLTLSKEHIKAQAEYWKKEIQLIEAKAKRRKKDTNYKDRTVLLYRRILEDKFLTDKDREIRWEVLDC